MKLFAFIMAFLVLGLSCLSCADGSFTGSNEKAKTEIVKHQEKGEDHQHKDYCSPFCHCTCCASLSLSHPVTETVTVNPWHNTQYASHYIASVIEISLPVWQPPQLV